MEQQQQQQQQQEEIEVNFRLDPQGRTAPKTDAKQGSTTNGGIRYDPHAVQAELLPLSGDGASSSPPSKMMDELLLDCEISDSGLMPRTFWMPCNGTQPPRCSLEQMALNVFQHHVPAGTHYDVETSGAEWWVQIRPSPEAGRYTMHDKPPDDKDATNDNTKDMSQEGISFHWDKDEDLRILCGGSVYVHPHISTVTYLTNIGAPTLALNVRVNNLTGEWIVPTSGNTNNDSDDNNVKGFLSWPRLGKHLSFDGRYLHAAPSDLMEEGAFAKQCQIPPQFSDSMTQEARKKLQRQHRRCTFLVNIWLNHKPFGVQPFPDTMISKLSGGVGDEQNRVSLVFPKNNQKSDSDSGQTNDPSNIVSTPATAMVVDDKVKNGSTSNNNTRFHWPMGDCSSGELIKADIPLATVRQQASTGGSLEIVWQDSKGLQLSCTTNATSQEAKEEAPSSSSCPPPEGNNKPAKQPRLS